MRKLLLAASCVSLVLMLTPAALAQSSAAEAGSGAEGAPPPDVVFQEGGIVTLGGGVVGTDCRSFAISVDQGYDLGLPQAQVQGVLDQCQAAGFLRSAERYEALTALPDTGGPGLTPPVLMGGALLLAGLGVLGITVRRRWS